MVGSSVGLAILAPLVPVIAAAVYLDDPGPVFYKQRRAGMLKGFRKTDGLDAPEFEEFDMYKFRSMRIDAEKLTGAVLAAEGPQSEALDADISVPGLIASTFGRNAAAVALGSAGGKATSLAKSAAARANGAKGGRPSGK